MPVKTKDFLSVLDLSHEELERVLDLAAELKQDRADGIQSMQPLAGKHVALLFEKPSLRTRTTFTIAVRELGGEVIEPHADVAFGGRETIEDVARNFERWLSGVVVRTFGQDRLDRLAAAAPKLHVVNALTDEEHPCQALADMMTLRERLGDAARAHAGVRGRRQQRGGVAGARGRDAGHARARRVADGIRAAGRRGEGRGSRGARWRDHRR